MNLELPNSWEQLLHKELEKQYFKDLRLFIENEYEQHDCYPNPEHIFAAFKHCSLEDTKVVIIGQDPYHGPGQANGLSFSVNDGVTFPPSLINIFKEIKSDLELPIPNTGNLERWAKQGVLLLNTTLTVRQGKPNSHQKKGWETFTDAVIQNISLHKENVVFLLWGSFAKTKTKLIDSDKHNILISGHPSPMSANRGHWFGNKHFSTTNQLLQSNNLEPIKW